VGFALVGVLATAIARGAGSRTAEIFTVLVPAFAGLLTTVVVWRRKAVVARDGLDVRSLLGWRRVRFEAISGFTYDARAFRLYLFLPLGRMARLTVEDEAKGRVVFHDGFARFDTYLPIVMDLVVAATVRRMKDGLDHGKRAQFGKRVSVDRATVYVKGVLFGESTASIEELQLVVEDGEVVLASPREQLGRFPIRSTPNLLALPQLMEELSVTKGRPRPEALQSALAWGRR
jgi:hypothetical protein